MSDESVELELAEDISQFFDDPYGYVMYAFPWGVEGGPLEEHEGPDDWQREDLQELGRRVRQSVLEGGSIQFARSSGHGIGKSAFVSWIILWAMSTRSDLNGVVTAGTRGQLEGKTWRELSIWHKRATNSHWFKWTATKFYHVDSPESWACFCVPWREENADAFAGQHEREHGVLVIYDEASAVSDSIWEVSEGAMTTAGAIWLCYGNPVRNSGRFRECFEDGKFSHRWDNKQIDSREAKMTDKKKIAEWIEDYGEDSDFVRVRVKGQFPRAGTGQFIPSDIVEAASQRTLEYNMLENRIMGVDVARFGDDETVVVFRQGRIMLGNIFRFNNLDLMQLANKIVYLYNDQKPNFVIIDGGGVGGGLVDILRSRGLDVLDSSENLALEDKTTYANKRTEAWGKMRDWLRTGQIPNNNELKSQLISPEYDFATNGKMRLEGKKDMKKRGLHSPDIADSLSLTFYVDFAVNDAYEKDLPDDFTYDIMDHIEL